MIKLRQVFGLYGSGYGSRSISTTLGISRTTIRKYLRIFNESSLSLKELLCKDDATLFDFFGFGLRLDALSALLPDYAKRLKKRGVTRKTLYSEYIKRYPQGYSYCSFNRFLRAYMASRKSLFKRFGISAHGESHFPKGLAFPRMAKVVSRRVWRFRAWRKSFPERFGVSAHGESHFPICLLLAIHVFQSPTLRKRP
mgnify:CR=1 FL=1